MTLEEINAQLTKLNEQKRLLEAVKNVKQYRDGILDGRIAIQTVGLEYNERELLLEAIERFAKQALTDRAMGIGKTTPVVELVDPVRRTLPWDAEFTVFPLASKGPRGIIEYEDLLSDREPNARYWTVTPHQTLVPTPVETAMGHASPVVPCFVVGGIYELRCPKCGAWKQYGIDGTVASYPTTKIEDVILECDLCHHRGIITEFSVETKP